MQKITRTYNVFSFDELNIEAKKKVINDIADMELNHNFWAMPIIWDFTDEMAAIGYEIEDAQHVYYQLYGQGCGVSFEASVNLDKFLKAYKLKTKYKSIADLDLYYTIEQNDSHYVHQNTMDCEYNYYSYEPTSDKKYALMEDLKDHLLEVAKDKARELHRNLDEEAERLSSEDYAREISEANDYQYLEDGTHFN